MKKKLSRIFILFTALSMIICMGSPASATEIDLIGLLTKNLGVTNTQAEGGAGAIFNTVSKKMSAEDFSKVTDAMPEVQSLMAAAPAKDKASGALSSVSSLLGEKKNDNSSMAGLTGIFSKLGLSSEMVGKFIPIILEYAQGKGGDGISSLLNSALQL